MRLTTLVASKDTVCFQRQTDQSQRFDGFIPFVAVSHYSLRASPSEHFQGLHSPSRAGTRLRSMRGVVGVVAALAPGAQVGGIAVLGLMIEVRDCKHDNAARDRVRFAVLWTAALASIACPFADGTAALLPVFRIPGFVFSAVGSGMLPRVAIIRSSSWLRSEKPVDMRGFFHAHAFSTRSPRPRALRRLGASKPASRVFLFYCRGLFPPCEPAWRGGAREPFDASDVGVEFGNAVAHFSRLFAVPPCGRLEQEGIHVRRRTLAVIDSAECLALLDAGHPRQERRLRRRELVLPDGLEQFRDAARPR